MKAINRKSRYAVDSLRDLGTLLSKSRGNTWWELLALMSVSAVLITGIVVVGNEMEGKKEYVEQSEPAGQFMALTVVKQPRGGNPATLEVSTDRWLYTLKGSFAARIGDELTQERMGNGDRKLCAPQRAICTPIEGRAPISGPAEAPSQTPPADKE